MRKIIIDTDPGQDIDDLLAILFVLKRPEFDVLAITAATYPADRRARLVKRLLRHLGRGDIPVAAGFDAPPEMPSSIADRPAFVHLGQFSTWRGSALRRHYKRAKSSQPRL